ncbi:hypothetical protein [Hydrogenophaga sp. NFH-34]|uniref:hypothetical protein n=1 Tax=Hydrogenophaga sp. NFH-34 TaxID=2744446 RepID=UPI001F2C53DC|nr:hypothetical protein [Hydrogenophaga sp. NFH-34]
MQAPSKFKRGLIMAAAIATITLAGCGGGDEDGPGSVQTPELRTHTVSPADSASGKVGMRVPIDSYTETFGTTIEQVEWQVEPIADAEGDLKIADPTCTKGEKSVRTVPGSDKVIEALSCETTVMALDGAKGKFEVTSRVTLGTGSAKKASFVFTATK